MFTYDLKYQSKQDFCYICKIYLYSTEGTSNTLFYLYFTCLISWSSTSMAYLKAMWPEMNNLQNASCRFLRKGLGLVSF